MKLEIEKPTGFVARCLLGFQAFHRQRRKSDNRINQIEVA